MRRNCLLFSQNKEWRGGSYSSTASLAHSKTSLGPLPRNSLKGASLFLRLRGGDDVTTIVVEWGACVEPAGLFWRELF